MDPVTLCILPSRRKSIRAETLVETDTRNASWPRLQLIQNVLLSFGDGKFVLCQRPRGNLGWTKLIQLSKNTDDYSFDLP